MRACICHGRSTFPADRRFFDRWKYMSFAVIARSKLKISSADPVLRRSRLLEQAGHVLQTSREYFFHRGVRSLRYCLYRIVVGGLSRLRYRLLSFPILLPRRARIFVKICDIIFSKRVMERAKRGRKRSKRSSTRTRRVRGRLAHVAYRDSFALFA